MPKSERWLRHSHQDLETLQDLLRTQNTQSSYRGFALAGEEFHLQAYRADVLGVKLHEATIRMPVLSWALKFSTSSFAALSVGNFTRSPTTLLSSHTLDINPAVLPHVLAFFPR
jgi:hypothetical protein